MPGLRSGTAVSVNSFTVNNVFSTAKIGGEVKRHSPNRHTDRDWTCDFPLEGRQFISAAKTRIKALPTVSLIPGTEHRSTRARTQNLRSSSQISRCRGGQPR